MDDLFGTDDDVPDWFQKDDDGPGENGYDEDGGEDEGGGAVGGTLHVLILLECSPEMMAPLVPDPDYPSDEGLSAVTVTLQAVDQLLRTKIRTATLVKTGQRDGVGVLLYATKPRAPRVVVVNSTTGVTHNKAKDTEIHNDDGDDNDDDDEDDVLYGALSRPSPHTAITTVHELLPLEPPGRQSVETLQTMLPHEFPGPTDCNLSDEYLADTPGQEAVSAAAVSEANDFYESSTASTRNQSCPLLDALSRAVAVYSSAPCVRQPTKTSSTLPTNDTRQIWIVTARDSPLDHHHRRTTTSTEDEEDHRLLTEKCKDIHDAGIELYVWPVVALLDPTGMTAFRPEVFYAAVAQIPLLPMPNNDSDEEDAGSSSNVATVTDEWIQILDSHYKKTRPAYRVPLLLTGWKERHQEQQQEGDPSTGTSASTNSTTTSYKSTILLDFYNLQQTSKEPPLIPIHQETGKVLGKVRQILSANGADVLAEQRSFDNAQERRLAAASRNSHRLRTFVEFGSDSRVSLTLADKALMKQQSNANSEFASLILLGFKHETAVPFYHAIEKSYFAYPSDAKSPSSIDAFAHLHQSMLRKSVVAIGELLTRVTATSRLVVLRALPEELEPSDDIEEPPTQRRPPGLLVTALPFNDEMRAIEPDVAALEFDLAAEPEPAAEPLVSADLLQAAVDLIQKQTLAGVEIGSTFRNAAMCRFWNEIERRALGGAATMDEDVTYDTEINAEQILKRASVQIDALSQMLPNDEDKPRKILKRKVLEPDTSGIDWETLYRADTLDKCKVPDLKKLLKSIGEPVTGNKSVLLDRVKQHLELNTGPPVKSET